MSRHQLFKWEKLVRFPKQQLLVAKTLRSRGARTISNRIQKPKIRRLKVSILSSHQPIQAPSKGLCRISKSRYNSSIIWEWARPPKILLKLPKSRIIIHRSTGQNPSKMCFQVQWLLEVLPTETLRSLMVRIKDSSRSDNSKLGSPWETYHWLVPKISIVQTTDKVFKIMILDSKTLWCLRRILITSMLRAVTTIQTNLTIKILLKSITWLSLC